MLHPIIQSSLSSLSTKIRPKLDPHTGNIARKGSVLGFNDTQTIVHVLVLHSSTHKAIVEENLPHQSVQHKNYNTETRV